jgi:hypothetical protein
VSRLTAERRNALPNKEFAGPDRSFPIDTENRARNALARVSQFHPELKARVTDKVHAKYPDMGKD